MSDINSIDISKLKTKHEAAKFLRSKGFAIVAIANRLNVQQKSVLSLLDYQPPKQIGSLKKHLNDRHYVWLERHVPKEMSIAEYLIEALLEDVMEPENA